MALVEYPDTLPIPARAPLVPAERRRISDLPGPRQQVFRQIDYLAEQEVEFPPFTDAQASAFDSWWRNDLAYGGQLFSANWPLLGGTTLAGVRRWLAPPTWRKVSNRWQVSGRVQVRGLQGVTSAAPQAATGTYIADITITNTGTEGGLHPHLVDAYVPDGTINRVICMLHGGAGDKDLFARMNGIVTALPVTDAGINWSLLQRLQAVLLFPRGQYCDGTAGPFNPDGVDTTAGGTKPGTRTWSNWFTWSQANDSQFLGDLSTYVQATWPGLTRCLFGHSNGGFMAQRMWMSVPNPWQRMACVSGPAAWYYDGASFPATVRPMISFIGGQDTTLSVTDGVAGAGDHFFERLWYQNPANASVANVDPPGEGGYMGEFEQFKLRVAARNTFAGDPAETVDPVGGVRRAVDIGYTRLWSYCNAQMQLRLIEDSGHSIAGRREDTGAGPSIQSCLGYRVLVEANNWFASF